jgi:hypothetical protein
VKRTAHLTVRVSERPLQISPWRETAPKRASEGASAEAKRGTQGAAREEGTAKKTNGAGEEEARRKEERRKWKKEKS